MMASSVIWSSSPTANNKDDCIVVALNDNEDHPLFFCRPGDEAVFYKGQLHLLSKPVNYGMESRVCIIDFARREPEANVCNVFQPAEVGIIAYHIRREYLVESNGSLLMVYRYWRQGQDNPHLRNMLFNTFKFLVFKLEENNKKNHNEIDDDPKRGGAAATHVWVKQSRLEGNQALFLGRCCSFSLSTSKYPGLKANSIYFAYNYGGLWHPLPRCSNPNHYPVGPSIGIYHLEDERIDSPNTCPCDSNRFISDPLIWIKPPI